MQVEAFPVGTVARHLFLQIPRRLIYLIEYCI